MQEKDGRATLLSISGGEMGGANPDRMVTRLMESTSKLRLNDARFLLYSILDTVVDEVLLLIRVLETALRSIEDEVDLTLTLTLILTLNLMLKHSDGGGYPHVSLQIPHHIYDPSHQVSV